MTDAPLLAPLAIATISHHTAKGEELEACRFPDEIAFLQAAGEHFRGVLLLQTCNRVEVLVQGDAARLSAYLSGQGKGGFSCLSGRSVLVHLLELAAGIDSMIVGEDQILGQMKTALATARQAGTASPLIELCIDKAVHVGIQVRRRTQINRGAVSIGSAAVLLAEQQLGSLERRHILVVGSGEMGMLVAQALAAKRLTAIYVANRTYERAVILAEKIGGRAVNLKDLYHYIALSDVVISCTSAPHPIIRRDELAEAMKGRVWPSDRTAHPLILIDIAQPRDVEEGAERIEGVRLFNIDSLRSISDSNLLSRRQEAEKAREFIEEETSEFVRLVNRAASDHVLADLYRWAETIRIRERDRALARLGANDDRRVAGVVDDLSRVLVKKLLSDATIAIRTSSECGDLQGAEALVRAITQGEKVCFRRED
ncbi:MAG: glutamyl-tRNA reductase [Methanomicrobiales archaeon]|nr:glutamyl-tRNA reductase [Methanomicrobiales archaeon]MDI6876419.1 glutamyl-tRNA reductase [Methanomicrobiales archaeon]